MRKQGMIFTDPPWSVDYCGKNGKILNDNKKPSEALEFYKNILLLLYNFSTDDVNIYWWYAIMHMDVNMNAFRDTGWHFSQAVLWIKDNFVYSHSQLFHRCFEPCMVGWKDNGKSHYVNKTFSNFTELWTLNKKTFADMLDVWYQKRDNRNNYIHPTQKPVQLAERAIKRSSEENDIVLDAFGGSGSTLIACEQLNRRARVIELDPKYVDTIVTRYLQFKEETHVIKNGEKILW